VQDLHCRIRLRERWTRGAHTLRRGRLLRRRRGRFNPMSARDVFKRERIVDGWLLFKLLARRVLQWRTEPAER
jgi:hypothetical protein